MARRVTILINDDGTSQIESDVAVDATASPTPTPTAPPVEIPPKPPVEVLMEEFLKAIKRNRKGAFEALGFERCSSVPAELIEEKIVALRAVEKVSK